MKITIKQKPTSREQKKYTFVSLIEEGVTRVKEKDGKEILEVVSGKKKELTPRKLRILARDIVQTAKSQKISHLAVALSQKDFPRCSDYSGTWFYSTLVENFLLADYEFTSYKSKQKKHELKELLILTTQQADAKRGLQRGQIVAESTNLARDLANTPGGDMTPEILSQRVKKTFKGTNVSVKVLDHKAIQKLKMGGVLGVGQGASAKPRFIILEYWGKGNKSKDKPLVYVGKGVTFDTGGLQVKPGMSMYEMHMDMSGAASVIGALSAIAELKLKQNVVALIPAVENAVSDMAIRPGDVLKMMSGDTVDVLHTDAEGRLILADALHYAHRYKPSLVVDVATLTGAAVVAVGKHAHAIMTKDRTKEDLFRLLGEESGDYVHPLPLWEEYEQYIKGVHGDIVNVMNSNSPHGGSIIGGIFLAHFAKKLPWVHIDMAPRMTAVESEKLAKGATGEPTRLLVRIAENNSK